MPGMVELKLMGNQPKCSDQTGCGKSAAVGAKTERWQWGDRKLTEENLLIEIMTKKYTEKSRLGEASAKDAARA